MRDYSRPSRVSNSFHLERKIGRSRKLPCSAGNPVIGSSEAEKTPKSVPISTGGRSPIRQRSVQALQENTRNTSIDAKCQVPR